ncbi:MAG: LamG domain-containing protein [Anaerolineales bacterium]|nr:LamG domain-containing protein [Anaerolineales bacterium]
MKHIATIFSLTILAFLLMAAVLLPTQPAYACGGYLDPDVNADYYYSLGTTPSTNGGNKAGAGNFVFNGTAALTNTLVTSGDQAAALSGGAGNDLTLSAHTGGTNLNAAFTERTYELWFRADSLGGRQQLFEHGGSFNGGGLYLDGNTLYGGVWDGNNIATSFFVSYTGITVGDIYHVVLVYTGNATNTLEMFVNSASVGVVDTSAASPDIAAGGNANAIGNVNGDTRNHDGAVTTGNSPFVGVIDEVAVYPTAAVQADVTAAFAGCHPTAVSLSGISAETTTPLALIGLAATLLVITVMVWKRERLQQSS